MPIIPSTWTGQTVFTVGGGGGGFPVYQFAKSLNLTITEIDTFIDLVGVCTEPVNREVVLDLISGNVQLFFKTLSGDYELITKENLTFDAVNNFVDATLGQLGLTVKCNEITELFLILRWDKDVEFNIFIPPAPAPNLTVGITNNNIATFTNYQNTENFFLQVNYNDFVNSSFDMVAICPMVAVQGIFNLDLNYYAVFFKDSEILPSNELMPFPWWFDYDPANFDPILKFGFAYFENDTGYRFRDSQPTVLSYNPETRVFTLSTN